MLVRRYQMKRKTIEMKVTFMVDDASTVIVDWFIGTPTVTED